MVNLRKTLEEDEGVIYQIYADHLGYPTFGIGHLITSSDPEYGQPLGTPVSPTRVQEAFEVDVQIAIDRCKKIYEWDTFPSEVQEILINMTFNLGSLVKWKNFNSALAARNWKEAAKHGLDSKWARQVPNRAKRLMDRLHAQGST